jgi:hypothetical protein
MGSLSTALRRGAHSVRTSPPFALRAAAQHPLAARALLGRCFSAGDSLATTSPGELVPSALGSSLVPLKIWRRHPYTCAHTRGGVCILTPCPFGRWGGDAGARVTGCSTAVPCLSLLPRVVHCLCVATAGLTQYRSGQHVRDARGASRPAGQDLHACPRYRWRPQHAGAVGSGIRQSGNQAGQMGEPSNGASV